MEDDRRIQVDRLDELLTHKLVGLGLSFKVARQAVSLVAQELKPIEREIYKRGFKDGSNRSLEFTTLTERTDEC